MLGPNITLCRLARLEKLLKIALTVQMMAEVQQVPL